MLLIFEGNEAPLSMIADGSSETEDDYTFDLDQATLSAVSNWNSPNTDGFAISGLSGDWIVTMSFTEIDNDPLTSPIAGLSTWAAKTTDGLTVDLALEQDRRVRLKPLCLADVNGNCLVDLTDFAHFSDCILGPDHSVLEGCELFDIDQDHDVDLRDFARFESAFSGF